jgi:hypothetical protein
MSHVEKGIQLLVGLVDISYFETRVHNFDFESDSEIASSVPVFFHQYHCFFKVLLMIFHKMLQPEFFCQTQNKRYFLFVVVVVSNSNAFVVLADLM